MSDYHVLTMRETLGIVMLVLSFLAALTLPLVWIETGWPGSLLLFVALYCTLVMGFSGGGMDLTRTIVPEITPTTLTWWETMAGEWHAYPWRELAVQDRKVVQWVPLRRRFEGDYAFGAGEDMPYPTDHPSDEITTEPTP